MQLTATRNLRALPVIRRFAPQYALLRLALRLGAGLSRGLAIGFSQGFDSGTMSDYIYQGRPQGAGGLGKLVDRIFLNQVGWRAARARQKLVQRYLRHAIRARRERDLGTHLLDIAAGSGRWHLELLCELGGDDLRLTCRDTDEAALAQGRRLADELWLGDVVRFERGDATDLDDLAHVSPTPDIAVAAGIYEILLDDAAVCRSLAGVRAILPPGGVLLFTTQISHPQLELIANTLTNRAGDPWLMSTRPLARVERWAREAGFSNVGSEVEPHGIFAVTQCVV